MEEEILNQGLVEKWGTSMYIRSNLIFYF